jgi:type I restriction enzyme S subunit
MMKARENIIDSNIDWLGKVPSDWKVVKLKYALANIPYPIVDGPFGTQLKADEYTESGVPLVRISNLDYKGTLTLDDIRFISAEKALELERSRIRLNDVIIGKTGATIGKSGLNDKIEYGIVSSSCLKVSVDESILAPHFFKYYVTSPNFQNIILQTASGSTRDTINITPMANLEVVLPSLDEQLQIVNFLDHQTAIIDQLIQQKEKLIELLKEKRQAVINEAVTKGLNPNAKMKDSGIDWLGEVPEHWNIKKIKHIKSKEANAFVDGPFGSNLKSEHFIENGDVYVIESGFITSGIFEQKRDFKTISYEHFLTINRSSCKGGDIIIAKIGANYGMSGILPELEKPAVVSGNSLKLSVDTEKNVTEFIHYFLLNLKLTGSLEVIVNATAQPALSLGTLNDVSIAIPPYKEQKQIANYIKTYSNQNDALINALELQIEKLKEYRQSIISEAVTGKIDVRDWQFNEKLTG